MHTAPGTYKSRFNIGYKRLAERQVPRFVRRSQNSPCNSYEICTRDILGYLIDISYLRVGNLAGLIFIAQINKTVSLQENLLSSSKLRFFSICFTMQQKAAKCFHLCLPRHQSLTTGFRNQATKRTITQILNGAKNCNV